MNLQKRRHVDPGGERTFEVVEYGSQEWAQRLRLELISVIEDMPHPVERVKRYFDKLFEERAWTLLNKPDGSYFATFEEFCAAAPPFGLGKPFEQIKPYLAARYGENAIQLGTVPPPKTGNQHTANGTECRKQDIRSDRYLRSILRAPAEIQALYKEQKVSQKLAAKLGPKKPTEQQLATQSEIVLALREIPRERKAVDAKIRQVLGQKKMTVVEQAARLFQRMTAAQKAQFLRLIKAN